VAPAGHPGDDNRIDTPQVADPMPGKKYAPLNGFLIAAADRGLSTVEMDFPDLARLVGGLPTSAYRRRQWWANGYLVQAVSWRSAGWRVTKVDLDGERVRFTRDNGPTPRT
jgi:hypothetical protein